MITKAVYTTIFYILSVVSVLFALQVVHSKKLLHAAIALMAVLVASAGFYIMLGYEFLAGVQVLVYVGGIAIFIVFAIMLTSSADLQEDKPPLHRKVLGTTISAIFFCVTSASLLFSKFPLAKGGVPPVNDADALGRKLLDYGSQGFVLPFEIVSLLLLAAVIGGIVIGRKIPPPAQPFTTGGDEADEATAVAPKKQLRDEQLLQKEGDT